MNDETTHRPASSPCSAHEADPAYMGLLPRDEIVSELQVLLEAERAGARIARESAIEARDADASKVEGLEHLLEDETHCCKVLIACLEHLGETPSRNIGDFYQKCMAIDDLDDRLNLVDKGQRWVLRKVEAMLPRLSDPKLVAAMKDVRDRHR
jgi:hypothetical protein